jgi:mannose-6-phosphate isomerase-like protein (cupin superfamily)
MIRYAKLSLPFNLKAAQQELAALNSEWQEHFNTRYYEGSWKVLALRSPGGSDKNIIPDLVTATDYQDTAFMQHFPSASALLSTIKCPVMAVRFLNLQAGAVIKPHRDNELAFEKGEARLHFPIITNPQVSFNMEDERIPLQEGDCWYINANLTHSVANRGTADRIHLVIDCKVNSWLKQLMSYATEVSQGSEDSNLPDIIRELRIQNTDTSHKLANQLEQQLSAANMNTPAI